VIKHILLEIYESFEGSHYLHFQEKKMMTEGDTKRRKTSKRMQWRLTPQVVILKVSTVRVPELNRFIFMFSGPCSSADKSRSYLCTMFT